MDTLSDVLALFKPHSYAAAGFDFGAAWSVQFPAHDGIKCYALASGHGWIVVEGQAPVFGSAGDCFLLPRGLPVRITSDLALTPTPAQLFFADTPEGAITRYDGGGYAAGVAANFLITGNNADMLLSVLPPVVHIRHDADRESLRWIIEQMMGELRDPLPGKLLVLQQLAIMLLVKALRLHLADGVQARAGWLGALADKRMAAAIGAMHADPAQRWTLQALAKQAGMSRTTFTLAFKAAVGVSAMHYLTRWRMLLAADRLQHSSDAIAAIAACSGYESETSFSTAFKKMLHCSPRQYRQQQRAT